MKKIINIFKNHTIKLLVIALLVCCLAVIFFPRSLSSLLIENKQTVIQIDLINTNYYGENIEINLEGNEIEKFLNLLDKTYVFKNPIRKKYINGGGYGFSIFPVYSEGENSSAPPSAHIFTEKIITIEGKQYILYCSDKFIEEFEKFLK